MEENTAGTQEKKQQYEYVGFPKNVRQIGVPLPGTRIYLEDYVITYLKQNFVEAEDGKVAVLLGKRGEKAAEDGIFMYGAIALEEADILSGGKIDSQTWDKVHEILHRDFSGAQIMGCACGVGVWNSEMENRIRKLQKAEFSRQDQVVFLWDLCEKEEKIFIWQRGMSKELPGYYVYFEKNPQMQNFMLDKQKPISIDADYQDKVTSSMRHVIEEKEEERQKKWQMIGYGAAVAAGIAILFGVHMMMDSTARIKSMEKTVDTLSEYVNRQQEEVETMSRQAQGRATQIPFENQATDKPEKQEDSGQVEVTEQEDNERSTEEKLTSHQVVDYSGEKDRENREDTKNKTEKKDDSTEKESDLSEKMALQTMKKHAQSYIVQKGDTLSQIVWRQYHDFSYEKKVKKVNGISDADKIYEGQCILLPEFH